MKLSYIYLLLGLNAKIPPLYFYCWNPNPVIFCYFKLIILFILTILIKLQQESRFQLFEYSTYPVILTKFLHSMPVFTSTVVTKFPRLITY
jgi:hypothetical protein